MLSHPAKHLSEVVHVFIKGFGVTKDIIQTKHASTTDHIGYTFPF